METRSRHRRWCPPCNITHTHMEHKALLPCLVPKKPPHYSKRPKQCIPRSRTRQNEGRVDYTAAIVYSLVRPSDVQYYTPIKEHGSVSLNCMCKLPRQQSYQRGKYQLSRKEKKKPDQRPNHTSIPNKKERIHSRAPNATVAVFGEPNSPASTPGSWPLTTPFNSALRGAFSQKSVDGTTPLLSSALRGCLRYAIALSIKACLFVIPGSLAKSIIASALSCCAQASAPARRALMPLIPASTTQGSLFGSRGPPLALHRSCQLCATCPRSVWAIRLSSRDLLVLDSERFFCLAPHAGGAVGFALVSDAQA